MAATAPVCKFFVTGRTLAFRWRDAMIDPFLRLCYSMDTTSPPADSPVASAPASAAVPASRVLKENGGLFLIAIFELVKTVLFLVAAAGVFHLVNRSTQVELTRLLHVFRVNNDWKLVKLLLTKADLIDPYKVRISIILVVYAALHATEGIGLLLRKRWAEYFTVIMTALPLPYEVYLLVHHTTHSRLAPLVPEAQRTEFIFTHWVLLKILVLVGNVAIVAYLAYHLYHERKRGPHPRQDKKTGQPG